MTTRRRKPWHDVLLGVLAGVSLTLLDRLVLDGRLVQACLEAVGAAVGSKP